MHSHITVIYPKAIPLNPGCVAENFLAGPIRNAPPWHEEAIDILAWRTRMEKVELRIFSPKRRADFVRRFNSTLLPREVSRICSRQREWEFETQERAVRSAGILFWLPKHGEIKFSEKVYGAITQVELGYWLARASVDKSLRIAIGTDGVYNGELHTILYDKERLAPWILPLHTSIESLCEQSIEWVKTPYVFRDEHSSQA